MKIVITSDVYYPMINGAAVFARNLAGGLKKRGHDVMVIAPSLTGDFNTETDPEHGFTVVRLTSSKLPIYPDQINKVPERKELLGVKIPRRFYKNGLHVSIAPYNEMKKVLDVFEPDIIHNQSPGPVGLAAIHYAKKHNLPMISTDHAYPENMTQQVKLPSMIKKPVNAAMNAYFISFLRRSDYATMPTEQAIADCVPKNRRYFKVPVEAISNGVDLSRFSKGKANAEIYKQYGIDPKKPTVLYVGRIDPEKSLDVLLEAFALAVKKVSNAQLVFVGDGTTRPKLESLAQKREIADRVIFTGRVIGDTLPQLYRTAKFFAISSKTETQSIVGMEAMATGLPIVAVKAGALPELIKNGKTGLLTEADDPEAMAKALVKLLKSDLLCKKMSAMALKEIRRHDISYTLTRLEEIYQKVLDGRKKAGRKKFWQRQKKQTKRV